MAPGGKADIEIIIDVVNNAKAKINDTIRNLKTTASGAEGAVGKLNKQFGEMDKAQRVLDRVMGRTQRQFAGWALSIMFFGMALQRTFDVLWKSGQKTFQDVMHSVEGTVTGYDMLAGSVAYLGFTIGQALEPVAYFLYPIIDAISEWIVNNEELFRGIVIGIGIFGTLLTTVGFLKLGFDGIAQAFSLLTAGKITGLTGLFQWMATPVGAGVLAAIAALIALGAVSFKALKETPEAVTAITSSFKASLLPVLQTSIEDFKELGRAVFGVDLSWQDIAWTLAWVGDIVIKFLAIQTEVGRSVINVISAVVNAYNALWAAATGNVGGAKEALQAALKDMKDVVDSSKNMSSLTTQLGADVLMGPGGYKKQELEKQREQQVNIYINDFNARVEGGQNPLDALNRILEISAQRGRA